MQRRGRGTGIGSAAPPDDEDDDQDDDRDEDRQGDEPPPAQLTAALLPRAPRDPAASAAGARGRQAGRAPATAARSAASIVLVRGRSNSGPLGAAGRPVVGALGQHVLGRRRVRSGLVRRPARPTAPTPRRPRTPGVTDSSGGSAAGLGGLGRRRPVAPELRRPLVVGLVRRRAEAAGCLCGGPSSQSQSTRSPTLVWPSPTGQAYQRRARVGARGRGQPFAPRTAGRAALSPRAAARRPGWARRAGRAASR